MQILGLVADLGQRGEAGTDMEIHVAEIGMLRDVEADRHRGRVAVADLEIDVAHRRVECARIRRRRSRHWEGRCPVAETARGSPGRVAGAHGRDAHPVNITITPTPF